MHKYITLIAFLTVSTYLKAQQKKEDIPKFSHAIYGEFLGSSIFISGNYELGFNYNKSNRSKINFRLGAGRTFWERSTLIIGSNISIGKKRNFLEIGINRMFELSNYIDKQSLTSLGLGYRFQAYKGLFFHLIPTVLFFDTPQPNWDGTTSITPFVSLGLGLAF